MSPKSKFYKGSSSVGGSGLASNMEPLDNSLDMRHHSCDIPKVFSHVTIDTEQL